MSNRFDEMLEEEGASDGPTDISPLVKLTERLWTENQKLKGERLTLRKITLEKLNRFTEEGYFWALPLATAIGTLWFALIGWVVFIVLTVGPTGEYHLKAHQGKQGICTQVHRTCNWCNDMPVSPCYEDAVEAIAVLHLLQEGEYNEQEGPSNGQREETQGEESPKGSGEVQVPEVPGIRPKLQVKEVP
jgi:hypothetical protein